MLQNPLNDLVKSRHLSGYLGGTRISELGLIGYGHSHSQAQARAEICRMARALQFMAATGLKPSRGGRCYPKGDQNYRPPGADHQQGWYDPATRSFLLTEEPYPGRHQRSVEERKVWAARHGWETVQSHWGSIYGHGTELYLTAKAGGINLAGLVRRLAALPAPFSEHDWPGEDEEQTKKPLPPVEVIEMLPELASALKHQRDLDIAEAGPQVPELSGLYRGVDVMSRWDIGHELKTTRKIVDAMPDYVRERLASIWCDSKAQADYCVKVAQGRWFDGIEYEIRDAVRIATSGFNGLLVEDDRHGKHFDPEWEGDDYDYAEEPSGEPVEVDDEDL